MSHIRPRPDTVLLPLTGSEMVSLLAGLNAMFYLEMRTGQPDNPFTAELIRIRQRVERIATERGLLDGSQKDA